MRLVLRAFSGLLYLLLVLAATLFVGMPISLGSCWGLIGTMSFLPLLIWRLLDEERLLAKDLPGYTRYQNRVKYHLLPFIW